MKSSAKKMLEEVKFCVFDLETTGGNLQSDKIIEIGMVKIEKLKIVDKRSFLIRPNVRIPEFIQKLTSIKQKDLEDAPTIKDVITEILDFMNDSILVAHNTSFDVPFFNSELTRLGRSPLSNPSICTNLMTKYLIPNLMNSNLHYMSKIFGIKHGKAHRALDDAQATAELLLVYLKIFIKKNITKLNHLYYPRNRYELDRTSIKKNSTKNKKDDSVFTDTLNKIKTPFLLTVKGDQGLIIFAIPCENTESEKTYLIQHLEQYPWQNISIRLFGHFVEALIQFAPIFHKLNNNTQQKIINLLWQDKLPDNQDQPPGELTPKLIADLQRVGDFIILPHLVPDQYFVTPLVLITPTSSLIFRLPAHRKKLQQYINARLPKWNTAQQWTNKIPAKLQIFFSAFIKQYQEQLFILKKSSMNQQVEKLEKKPELLLKNNHTYDYPKEYI